MPGIWDATGNKWIEFSEEVDHKNLTREFATSAARGEIDVGGFLSYMPDPDPVLRKRGDDAKVLGDLTADDQVCTAIQNRKLRVLNRRDYDFKPGVMPGEKATTQSGDLCDALTKDLQAINLRNVFSQILDTPFYGVTTAELMFEVEAGKYRLKDIIPKPRDWFTFDKERRPALKRSGGDPLPLPSAKFIIVQHSPTYENPYGLRLLSRCLWPVAFKRGGVEFLTRFLEKFGMPWPVIEVDEKADKAKVAAQAAAMVQDAVLVVSRGTKVDLAQSSTKSGGDAFEAYLKRWDKAIFKVIMGQTLTSEMDGQGSRAAAQVHEDVADDIAEADQWLVESAMNDLATIYRDLNAPDVVPSVFAYHEPEDYEAQADLDTKLHGVGVRFTKGHFERRYALNPDEFELESEPTQNTDNAGGNGDGGSKDGEYAENKPGHQELLDAWVKALLPKAAKANDAFINDLVGLLDRAESYQDIQVLLAEHLGGNLDQSDQEELLADLMAAAALMGRAAVAAGD